MNNQSPSARRAHPKTPTTQAVVSKVQRITATKNNGRQAEWVGNLQRAVDKKSQPTKAAPPSKEREPAKDNRANQRNPNHEQFHKSRGLHGRPLDWDKSTSKGPVQPKPGAKSSK